MIQSSTPPKPGADEPSQSEAWTWDDAQRLQALTGGSGSDDDDDEPKPVSPVRIVVRTLRGRWAIAITLAVLLGAGAGTAGYVTKHPVYVSGGLVQLSPIKSNILYNDTDDSRLRLFDAFVQAEFSYIQSTPVLERALKSPDLESLEWASDFEGVTKLRKTLEVTKKEGLITITAAYGYPFEAAAIVNTVLSAYETMHLEELKKQDTIRERELAKRGETLLTKLQDFDKQILEIGQEYGTESIGMAHARKVAEAEEVAQRISELALTIAQKESDDSSNNVNIGDSEIKRLLVLDHAMADMLFERSKMAADLAVLETQHAEEHHEVIEAKARLKVIDKAIEDRRDQLSTLGSSGALTQSSNGPKEESADDLKALQKRFASRHTELQAEARELNERLVKLQFLGKERDETRLMLEETRRALEQVRVESQHSLPGTIDIKSRGRAPTTPSADKRATFAAAGGVFGFFGGLAMTAVFGFLQRKYRFSDDLGESRLDYRLIGTIPASKLESPESDPHVVHAAQKMRVDLQLTLPPSRAGQVIGVLGASAGSGTSMIARSLAEAFAEAGVQTILVDSDFTDSGISRDLGFTDAPGVREILHDGDVTDRLKATVQSNLQVLPIGCERQIRDAQVSHRPMAALMKQLRTICDLAIIDLGPLPDRLVARLGGALADHVLCVVSAGESMGHVNPVLDDLLTIAPERASTVWNRAVSSDPAIAVAV